MGDSGRAILWVGDSRRNMAAFPREVRIEMGYALHEAQSGRKAACAKPMKGLGAGVMEIVADHDGNAFRAFYAVKLGADIYVLHAFQKKSKRGIATPKAEIELVRQRLKQVQALKRDRLR